MSALDGQINRVEGIANGVIGLFFALEEKTEMLHPIISDDICVNRIDGNAYAIDGFNAVRLTLALDAVKDCSRITFDKNRKSPSIHNLIEILECQNVRDKLKEKHIQRENNEQEFDRQYNNAYRRVVRRYKNLQCNDLAQRIKDARNKVVAHSEVQFVEATNSYRLCTIDEFRLNWSDPAEYVRLIRPLIKDLAFLVLATSFADKSFTSAYRRISKEFWKHLC